MTFHKEFVEFVAKQVEYDVVIAGAGPVGLFLACELALAKCSVLVVEKAETRQSPLKHMPFGLRGLNSLSVESLDRRGLLEELTVPKQMKNPHMNAVEGPKRMVGHFAGIPIQAGKVDETQWPYRLASSPAAMMVTTMEEMETVLTRRAEALGVVIRYGCGVTGFEQRVDGVTVRCGERTFAAKWLVGCDGSRSVVRKGAGIAFEGTEPEFTGYSVQVELEDAEKLKPGRNVTERGMYLQSQPGYVVMQDFDGGAFHASGQPITREHVQEVLRRISDTDVTVLAVQLATTWTDRARQAVSYRSGRVLLAGDAAHIHAPLGGQGMNLGLGDAMNLGWKLAAVVHGGAPEGLLESYEAERHPLGMKVLDWSRAQAAMMKPDPDARALYAIFRDLMETSDGATYVAGRVWGVTTKYELGGEHPMVGRSAPNFLLTEIAEREDGVTVNELLRDGLGVMLAFEGRLAERAREYGVKYVAGCAKEQLGLSAVLVRPDGVVVWVAEGAVDEASLQLAMERWFVRREKEMQ